MSHALLRLTWFASVLAQIYYFKPQTLSVSTLFLLVLTYWFGNAMHVAMPSHGIFRWLNPGPFNSTVVSHEVYGKPSDRSYQSKSTLRSSSCRLPHPHLLQLSRSSPCRIVSSTSAFRENAFAQYRPVYYNNKMVRVLSERTEPPTDGFV